MGTKVIFASVYHPQSNGAVERANSIIFGSIKKCMFDQKKGKWADELPKVIWSQHLRIKNNKVHPIKATLRCRSNDTGGA